MTAVYSDCRCPVCRSEEQAILAEDLRKSLGAFARWMNRPLTRVHVYTWRLAVKLDPGATPFTIRYRPAYRSPSCKQWRKIVARVLRNMRRRGVKVVLPKYDERSVTYV